MLRSTTKFCPPDVLASIMSLRYIIIFVMGTILISIEGIGLVGSSCCCAALGT